MQIRIKIVYRTDLFIDNNNCFIPPGENHPARLRIHTSDQAESAPTVVQITINGRTMEKTLSPGLGIQRTDPAHRAFPATLEFDLPGSDLRARQDTNTLTVRVLGQGWFSWDALDLVSK